MSGTVNRKMYYYTIDFFDEGGNEVRPSKVFDELRQKPFTEDGRIIQLNPGSSNLTGIEVDRTSNNRIKGKIGKLRREDLPTLKNITKGDNDEESLELETGQALYDPTHFVIFLINSINIIGIEYNHNGPRPSSLKRYIPRVLTNPVSNVEMDRLAREDIVDKLDKMQEIRKINFRALKSIAQVYDDLDESVGSMLKSSFFDDDKQRIFGHETIEVIIRPERRGSLKDDVIERLKGLVHSLNDNESLEEELEKFKVYGRIEEDLQWVDIFEDFLIVEKKVLKLEKGRRVKSENMYAAIENGFQDEYETISEILDIFDHDSENNTND